MNITPAHFTNVNNVCDEGLTGLSGGAPDPDENPDDSKDSDDSDNSCGDYCRWTGKDQANDEHKKNNARTATDDRKSPQPHARKISMASTTLSHRCTEGEGGSHSMTTIMSAFQSARLKFVGAYIEDLDRTFEQ